MKRSLSDGEKKRKRRKRQKKCPKMETIQDIIDLSISYEEDIEGNSCIDWVTLYKLRKPLQKLNDMIGMESLKKQILDMVVYFLLFGNEGEYAHTVICGEPGVGKTMVANILAEIYCCLGFLENERVIKVDKQDFIGKYIGHTESKTKDLLERAKGSVLFIDEAYSMGSDRIDSFSKIAIDMLCQHLLLNKFVCIIAGYRDELDKYFFSQNPGLSRRFPVRLNIEEYAFQDLCKAFVLFCKETGWVCSFEEKDIYELFRVARENGHFNNWMGDVRNLVQKSKLNGCKRMIRENRVEKVIKLEDVRFEEIQKERIPDEISHFYL